MTVVWADSAIDPFALPRDSDIEEDEDARARRLFPRIDWHQLWADDTAEEWVLYPLVRARRLISLYSPAKIGKSLLMLEVAVAISRGEEALGHTPPKRYRVLYVDFENDPVGDLRARLKDMGYGADDLDHLDYLSFPTMADLDSPRGASELMAVIHAYGSEIVVIDTISRAVAGEENSNDTWLDFYRHTGLRLKQAGVALIRLDHTGKDEAKGQRGGSAKSGDVDAIWRLTKITDDRLKLECTDTRFPLDTKLLDLIRLRDPLRHAVENLSAATERERKILDIIAVADEVGLPSDAPREEVRAAAKAYGIKARTDIYADVAKRRKLSPTPREDASADQSPSIGSSRGQAGHHSKLSSNPVPESSAQSGTETIGPAVPVPTTTGGDSGTTGQKSGRCDRA